MHLETVRQENLSCLEHLLHGMWDKDLAQDIRTTLEGTDFLVAPASTKYHGSFLGGLFNHSMEVVTKLQHLTQKGICHSWQRPDSPIIIGLLHDACKIGKYTIRSSRAGGDPEVLEFKYNEDQTSYGGHGSDSVIKILQHLVLTEEEALCIRYHMGAYEKTDWDALDRAIKQYPNVLWTHTADMYASKIAGV